MQTQEQNLKVMDGLLESASLALYVEKGREEFLQWAARYYDGSLLKYKPDDESVFPDEAYWAIQYGINRDRFIQLATEAYDLSMASERASRATPR